MNSSIADVLAGARHKKSKSQEYMAIELGVSKNTVVNWEKGLSSPSVKQCFIWFKTLGINPLRPFLEYLYPETFKNICHEDEDEKIRNAMHTLIDEMPPRTVRQLAYLFLGEHQSSPVSVMELLTAHLHNNMPSRIMTARVIADAYDMCRMTETSVCEDNIEPNMELLHASIELAKKSVEDKTFGYSSSKESLNFN